MITAHSSHPAGTSAHSPASGSRSRGTGLWVLLVGGAILVGLLALATEIVLGLVERFLRPRSGGPRAPTRLEAGPRPSELPAEVV